MLAIFEYDFMLRAFAAGIVTSVLAPTIGLFLVTRRYSFMADTLAHVSLAGIALGALTGLPLIPTSIAASAVGALWVEHLRSSGRAKGETALSLFLSGGLALAAVLLSMTSSLTVNINSVLFGSITTVTQEDVWMIVALGAIVLTLSTLLWKGLFAIALDEDLAMASGLPVRFLNQILVLMAAVTVSLSMRTVGILLVGALMIIPVLAAMQLRKGFFATLLLAIGFSLTSTIAGLILSFYLNLASGGTIVLIAIGFFLAASLGNRE